MARRPVAVRVGLAAPAGSQWQSDPSAQGAVIPRGSAKQDAVLTVPSGGQFDVYVRGSHRGLLRIAVDGRRIASERHRLSHTGQYEPLGTVRLAPGRHKVEIDYTTGVLHPGSGGPAPSLGPLFFDPRSSEQVERVSPARARTLCGASLDWVEAVTR